MVQGSLLTWGVQESQDIVGVTCVTSKTESIADSQTVASLKQTCNSREVDEISTAATQRHYHCYM